MYHCGQRYAEEGVCHGQRISPQRRRSSSAKQPAQAVVKAQPRTSQQPKKPMNMGKIQEQYAQSLEQQIQLLEMENNFLKSKSQSDLSVREDHSMAARCGRCSGSIMLREGNEVSLNGKDWCKLPSFHPPINSELIKRYDQGKEEKEEDSSPERRRPSAETVEHSDTTIPSRRQSHIGIRRPSTISEGSENSRRGSVSRSTTIDFKKPDRLESPPDRRQPTSSDQRFSERTSSSISGRGTLIDRRVSQQTDRRSSSAVRRQSTVDGSTRRESMRRSTIVDRNLSDAAHFENATILTQQIQEMEGELRIRDVELDDRNQQIAELNSRLKSMEDRLSARAESDTNDKRALMEELLELQRRLDDLTPILAEKEAIIARLENDRDDVLTSLRSRNSELMELQHRISEKSKEESLLSERQRGHHDEIGRLKDEITSLKLRNSDLQREQHDLRDNFSDATRDLKEEQMRTQKEKLMSEQISSENSRLIRENASLSAEVTKLRHQLLESKREYEDHITSCVSRAQLFDAEESEKRLQRELMMQHEKLRTEQEKRRQLELQLREREEIDLDTREGRERMQKELDALQALSRSLSDENKALREEKMTMQEKIESLKQKLFEKDGTISEVHEQMRRMTIEHDEMMQKIEKEARSQQQRTLELEEVSKKLREISESGPIRERTRVVTIMEDTTRSSESKSEIKGESKGERSGVTSIKARSQSVHTQIPHIRLASSEECSSRSGESKVFQSRDSREPSTSAYRTDKFGRKLPNN